LSPHLRLARASRADGSGAGGLAAKFLFYCAYGVGWALTLNISRTQILWRLGEKWRPVI
jgi:hypothetical protein